MTKRILSLMLAFVVIAGVCFTAVPKLSASAGLYAGDVITITDKAGGSVYCSANVNGTHYSVSAMNASKAGDASTYYAWCASYGVLTPAPGRQYRLYDWNSDYNAGTAFIDGAERSLLLVYPWEGVYMYLDTGLKQYIDFSWAMSCIKAAEALAGTTELSFAWRMAVELAIRSEFLDINAAVSNGAFFGSGIMQHFTEVDCDTVAEFAERTKNIADYASKHFVTWTPYAEKISEVELVARGEYRDDYLILYEAWMNKADCDVTVVKGKDLGVIAAMDGTLLTVKIPISKLKADTIIDWAVELYLDEGLNYNLMYGKPLNGGTDVQNIMVYETSGVELQSELHGNYEVFDEKAPITVYKTDTYGEALEGVGFTLYTVDASNVIKPYVDFPTKQTTDAGLATWSQLELGTYFIEESTPPANRIGTSWAVTKTVAGVSSKRTSLKEVTLKDGSGKAHTGVVIELTPGATNVELSVINELNEVGTVIIMKEDYHGDPLAGMKFTLYPIKGSALGTPFEPAVTADSGVAYWRNLELGEYFLVENYDGSGYIPYKPEEWSVIGAVDATYTTINGIGGWRFTLGGTTNVNFYATNEKVLGELNINKITDDGIAEPFKFLVTSDVGYSYTATLIPNIDKGYSAITIKGLDVYKEDGSFITYTITEVEVPDRYIAPAPYSFSFKNQAAANSHSPVLNYAVTLNNSVKTVNIVLTKSSFNGKIKDIEFTLKGSNGYSVTKKTDSTGKITFTNLPMYDRANKVTYTLSETTSSFATNLFIPVFSSDTLSLQRNGFNSVMFVIDKYELTQEIAVFNPPPSMEIGGVKSAELGGREGFTFVLTGSNGYQSAPFTTDASGEFCFGGLQSYTAEGEPIVYTLTEMPNALFKPMDPIVFDPSQMTAVSPYLSIVNMLKDGEIVITKNAEDGVVQGVKFQITSDYLDEPIVIETNTEGKAVFAGLDVYKDGEYITYTVTEIDVPDRYQSTQFLESFTFEAAMEAATVEDMYFTVQLEAENTLKRLSLELLKEDVDGNVLSGAEFAIEYSADGGETWATLTADVCAFTSEQFTEGVFRSDENGNVVVENLFAHYQYRITETKAPDGYMLWASKIIVEAELEGSADTIAIKRTIVNNPKPTLPNTGDAGIGYISIAVLALCLVGWLGFGKRNIINNI